MASLLELQLQLITLRANIFMSKLGEERHTHVTAKPSRIGTQPQHPQSTTNDSKMRSRSCRERGSSNGGETVRFRWTTKPEQILILESIFNNCMVNPSKQETIRIRHLLEKFGSVSDANVFYWFQNRRSRSRCRLRQLQASLAVATSTPPPPLMLPSLLAGAAGSNDCHPLTCTVLPPPVEALGGGFCDGGDGGDSGSGGGGGGGGEDCLAALGAQQMGVYRGHPMESDCYNNTSSSSVLCSSDVSDYNLYFPSGSGRSVTGLINGVSTEVEEGVDMKAMFGEEVILVHSSGFPVPVNHLGVSLQSLQHGESYFLVPRFP